MIQKNYVKQFTQQALSSLLQDEAFNLSLSGENMHYLRFNNSKVRQSTNVTQLELLVTLIKDKHSCEWTWMSRFDLAHDLKIFKSGLKYLRDLKLQTDPIETTPKLSSGPDSDYQEVSQNAPNLSEALVTIEQSNTDLAGLFISGTQFRGNSNSIGQFHWYQRDIHVLDYSVYTLGPDHKNKALKSTLALKNWDHQKLASQLQATKQQLTHFSQPSRTLMPQKYRAFLAPQALSELLMVLQWGGLSYNAYRTGRCALRQLIEKQKNLSHLVTIRENFNLGLDTLFNEQGEVSPTTLDLINQGELQNLLICSATASKYQVTSNFASASESPRSLEMLGGQLAPDLALQALGTGVYLGHLHYCNWSNLDQARITGMTRYGCFWVEDGQIRSPIDDFRFDVSLFDILGPQLEQLTQNSELIVNTETYVNLGLGGMSCPGALIKEFACVL